MNRFDYMQREDGIYEAVCIECGKVRVLAQPPSSNYCRHCSQKLATAKREETCLHRYGVRNVMEDQKFIDKITDTFMSKYGVKRAVNVPKYVDKMKNTMMDRYGVPFFVQSKEYTENSHFRVSNANKKFGELLIMQEFRIQLNYL